MWLLIEQGYIYEKISEDGKLVLYNYTNKCQFEKKWNDITLNSRGHVYEIETGKIVARPFSKFFNLSEHPPEKIKEFLKWQGYDCYEKMDGSLGIIYFYDGSWRINTRGSFDSIQSQEALKIMRDKYMFDEFNPNITYLVEIIYPENRIVIDYGSERKLILLAAFHTEHGFEISRHDLEVLAKKINMPIVKKWENTIEEMLEFQEESDLSFEGFVVRYYDGERIKIKTRRYLEIARIIANLSPLSLWKTMVNGRVPREALEIVPEEFQDEIDEIIKGLEMEYNILNLEVYNIYEFNKNKSRKEIGLSDISHKTGIFAIMNNKLHQLDQYIMKQIRPRDEDVRSPS